MSTLNPHTTDEQIVRLLQANQREGLSYLYDRYAATLYGVIYRILNQQEAAEEVLQDTFLKIWNNAASFDAGKGNLLGWMIRIARNAAIDRSRLRSFQRSQQQTEPEDGQGETVSFNPEIIGVKEVTEKLPPDQKALIDLIYFKGYTHSEAAEHLSLPLGTVKSRVRAAIQTLRKMLS